MASHNIGGGLTGEDNAEALYLKPFRRPQMMEKARAEVASHNMCSLCLSLCRPFSCIIPDSSRYSFVIYEFLRTSVLGFLVMSINKNWINISHLS